MVSVVTKGNTIYVPMSALGGAGCKLVRVEWAQSLETHSAKYWICQYTVKSGGDVEGVIFVQTNKVDEFKAKKIAGDNITLVVDDKFQYGQNRDKTKRFLVYQDKESKPYQHRFIQSLSSRLGDDAASYLALLGIQSTTNPLDIMRDFSDTFKAF